MLRRVTRTRGILLTTYGMVLHNAAALARDPAQGSAESAAAGGPLWDVMILDEASSSWITLPCPGTSLWCLGCLFCRNLRVGSDLTAVPMHLCSAPPQMKFRAVPQFSCTQALPASPATACMQASCSCSPHSPAPPATVCLQGHKIKNSNTQLAQRLREIPAGLRVIISGTPIQNNLMELHSLFDFVAKVRDANFERLYSLCPGHGCTLQQPASAVLQQQPCIASMCSRGKPDLPPCTVAAHAASTCRPKAQQVFHHSCQCSLRVQHQEAACPQSQLFMSTPCAGPAGRRAQLQGQL